jgi:uncharacterized glyoxalase superfamily protein PhnB
VINNVGGVIIWSDDVEKLSVFYKNVLELEPVTEREGFIAFSFGEFRLSISYHNGVHGRSKDPLRMMINFNVSDIDFVYRSLSEKGVTFLRLPEKEHWGGYVATFKDPDGNVVQLLQRSSD